MKKIFSLLLIALLLASCGTTNSFSKRKHLSGHFWKKSGGHGKPQENNFESSELSDAEAIQEKKGDLGITASSMTATSPMSESSSMNTNSTASANSIDKKIDDKTINESQLNQSAESSTKVQQKTTRENGTVFITLFLLWIVLGIVGLVFTVLWFILAAFEAVGIWMLILGLSLIGACIITLILFFVWILAVTGESTPLQ